VLSLGRLNLRKNLVRLIEAFERLGRPDLQLAIAGRADYGSDEPRRRLERSAVKEAVRFTGFIADPDLPLVMSAASLFVYPSLFEGFGLPPLEAAACGTPVVASNTAALPETLADAALLVDPDDGDALARAMLRLLTDEELRDELRRRGIERAARFTWEEVARRTVAAYGEAVRR
jgi:glycosyltransferase involved in cell wall biosynthesis